MIKTLLLIFAGGGLGSVTRYMLGRTVTGLHNTDFPLGTLTVNIVACFMLGVVVGFSDHKQLMGADARVFWAIGFCGGFSTFSTFSYETLQLLHGTMTLSAMAYVAASLVLCLVAVWGGIYLGRV